MKPTVTYKPLGKIVVGEGASIVPFNHPGNAYDCDPFLGITNGEPVFTSTVVSYDKATGRFETMNTIYVRAAK